jgi:disulfide oxidoreductase YuzD
MLNTINWDTSKVKVVNLKLDPKNVRLDIDNPSQDAIIQDLFKNEDAMQIVESIAQNGFFNQEMPIITTEGKDTIVLEGNRRISALKAILNPRLVPQQEAKLRALIKDMGDVSVLENVEAKVAPNREEASKIIASIHTVQSRKAWKPLRQAYFYYAQVVEGRKSVKQLSEEYKNVNIPEFVKMWEMHNLIKSVDYKDPVLQRKVASKNFPISTLERLYNNADFQTLAKIEFDEFGQISIGAKGEDFNTLLSKIVNDISDKKIDTRVLNKKTSESYKSYMQEIKDLKIKDAAKPKKAADFTPQPVVPATKAKYGIVPDDIVCTINYPAVKRVLEELKTLNYRKYPNATHDLLRSFLECSLKAYFNHKGVTVNSRGYVQLQHVLNEAKTHFATENVSLVQVVQKMTDQNTQNSYMYSTDYLNAVNHNHQIFSKHDDVEASWDQMENLIRYILDPPQ